MYFQTVVLIWHVLVALIFFQRQANFILQETTDLVLLVPKHKTLSKTVKLMSTDY